MPLTEQAYNEIDSLFTERVEWESVRDWAIAVVRQEVCQRCATSCPPDAICPRAHMVFVDLFKMGLNQRVEMN